MIEQTQSWKSFLGFCFEPHPDKTIKWWVKNETWVHSKRNKQKHKKCRQSKPSIHKNYQNSRLSQRETQRLKYTGEERQVNERQVQHIRVIKKGENRKCRKCKDIRHTWGGILQNKREQKPGRPLLRHPPHQPPLTSSGDKVNECGGWVRADSHSIIKTSSQRGKLASVFMEWDAR